MTKNTIDNLATSTKNRLKDYPALQEVVSNFIESDGWNHNLGYLTPLTVYIRKLNIDEPSLFDWDEETTEDFYSWGHNSRYGNVLEPQLVWDLDKHVRAILDYLDKKTKTVVIKPTFQEPDVSDILAISKTQNFKYQ